LQVKTNGAFRLQDQRTKKRALEKQMLAENLALNGANVLPAREFA
jgi:hypothetical protein